MTNHTELTAAGWIKSSFSGGESNCLYWKRSGATVLLTESSDPGGAMLSVPAESFAAFLAGARAGECEGLI
jgi:hypothetical protein